MAATKTMTATKAYNEVAAKAEQIKNGEPAFVPIESGSVLRQGDLYVTCLSEPLRKIKAWPGRQLAIGTTQGSRHIAEGDCDIYEIDAGEAAKALTRLVPATKNHRQFFGPAIHARGPVTITHPEHGHRTLPPGDYLITYQRVWANEIRRVAD